MKEFICVCLTCLYPRRVRRRSSAAAYRIDQERAKNARRRRRQSIILQAYDFVPGELFRAREAKHFPTQCARLRHVIKYSRVVGPRFVGIAADASVSLDETAYPATT